MTYSLFKLAGGRKEGWKNEWKEGKRGQGTDWLKEEKSKERKKKKTGRKERKSKKGWMC